MAGSLYPEQSLSLRESWDFLDREAKAVQAMISVLKMDEADTESLDPGSNVWLPSQAKSLEATITAVQWVLRQARHVFRQWEQSIGPPERSRLYDETNRYHETVPEFLNAISTSILQRRQKGISQVLSGSGSRPVFRLSEVHLSHSVTVRGVEILSSWINGALEHYWGKIPIANPILNISSGLSPMFQPPPRELTEIQLSDRLLGEVFSRILNLSYILMPRWAPSQIRYFALLGHEHFHRVLFLLQTTERVRERAYEYRREVELEGNQEKLVRAKENLEILHRTLSPRLRDLREIWRKTIDHVESYYSSEGLRWRFGDLNVNVAADHAEEFMCDAAGLVMCGPAQLYSSVSYLFKCPTRDEDHLQSWYEDPWDYPEHPPQCIRIPVQLKLLRRLGFDTHANRIAERFGVRALNDLIADPALDHLGKHYEHFTNDEFVDLLAETARDVVRSMTSARLRCQPHLTGDAQGELRTELLSDSPISEESYDARIEALIRKIQSGSVFPSDLRGYTPPDVLNAIWLKMYGSHEQSVDNELRMQWRQALKNISLIAHQGEAT